jgi:hypothetical protein
MSKRLSLLSTNNDLGALTVDPTNAASVLSHINDTTRFTAAAGIADRRTQGMTEPRNFIADKKKIWDSIVRGSDGAGRFAAGGGAATDTELALKLPGTANRFIPTMTSLVTEWQNVFTSLRAAGVPKDTAAFEADSHINLLFNQRVKMFTSAFPSLIDDAYEAGLEGHNMENRLMEVVSGIKDVPKSYKFEKYKKRAKKYKANKRGSASKST